MREISEQKSAYTSTRQKRIPTVNKTIKNLKEFKTSLTGRGLFLALR